MHGFQTCSGLFCGDVRQVLLGAACFDSSSCVLWCVNGSHNMRCPLIICVYHLAFVQPCLCCHLEVLIF